MVIPPIPTCWRCGSPVFNHLIRGYVCPHCENIRALKNIARVQRNSYEVKQHSSHDSYNSEVDEDEDVDPVTGFALGCFCLVVIWIIISSLIKAIV